MLKAESKKTVESFLKSAGREPDSFSESLSSQTYEAMDLILEIQSKGKRLHLTGIGKPEHVATNMARWLSSVGNLCYYLHGTEAIHDLCGRLVAGDVAISTLIFGETAEVNYS